LGLSRPSTLAPFDSFNASYNSSYSSSASSVSSSAVAENRELV
jgi:hypothetical protein